MNLGKLLGAGKSFVNGHKSLAFRQDRRVYVPKFGAVKNPFAQAVQTELPQPTPEISAAAPVVRTGPPVWAKTQKMPIAASSSKSLTSWTSKLNPASLWRSSSAGSTANVSQPVQTELSLDKVKVVHNDLTDAEVEIVPMKSRPARAENTPELQPARQSWELLGERMMEVKVL